MKNKEILAIATNDTILYYLSEIRKENDNMSCKTNLEKESSNIKIVDYTKRINQLISNLTI